MLNGCLEASQQRQATDYFGSVPADRLGELKTGDQSLTATLAPRHPARSVRGELVAQNSRHVLALAQQPDHIQVLAAFEVAPEQRKLFRPPSP